MRSTLFRSLGLTVLTAGVMSAGSISLTGSTDTVSFNNKGAETITLGSDTCGSVLSVPCTFGGSQSLGAETLTWAFSTPNTNPSTITYDPFGGMTGPDGGTFTAGDGVDSFNGTYVLNSWNFDGVFIGDFQGIDLNGVIAVTGSTLSGDPFDAFFSLPGATSYDFVLDVGDCTKNSRTDGPTPTFCIQPTDPTAQFISLTLDPNVTTPEPGTLALMTLGLAAAFGARRRMKNAVSAR